MVVLLLLVIVIGYDSRFCSCFDGFGAITFCDSFAAALVVLATAPAGPVRPKLINSRLFGLIIILGSWPKVSKIMKAIGLTFRNIPKVSEIII
jgi:extradiol dioxygenase family protein